MPSRRVVLTLVGSILFLGVTDPASATSPDRLTFDDQEVFTDGDLSEACGTEVVVTIAKTAQITLWRNEAGLVERELDRFPGSFITWSAPATGKSVKTRADLVSHWEYGAGAVLGGPATFTFQGMFFHLPGADDAILAGREVSVGVVEGFDNGVPVIESGTLVSFVGHLPEDLDFVDGLCGSLT